MKKLSILVLAVMVALLAGCGGVVKENNNPKGPEVTSSAGSKTESQKAMTDTTTDEMTSSDSSYATSSTNAVIDPNATTTSGETKTDKTTSQSTSSKSPTTTTTKPPVTSQTKPQPKPPVTSKTPSQTPQETVSEPKWATEADEKEVADRIIYYINKYRIEEGHCAATKLSPRLTEYAEYRSRQLVKSGLVHDTDDMRAAATALKYGTYRSREELEAWLSPGSDTTPYWEVIAGEACGGGVPILYKTVDELAETFATVCKNSEGHWSYVGADENKYIGVGVCYNGGSWYVAIVVANESEAQVLR